MSQEKKKKEKEKFYAMPNGRIGSKLATPTGPLTQQYIHSLPTSLNQGLSWRSFEEIIECLKPSCLLLKISIAQICVT